MLRRATELPSPPPPIEPERITLTNLYEHVLAIEAKVDASCHLNRRVLSLITRRWRKDGYIK